MHTRPRNLFAPVRSLLVVVLALLIARDTSASAEPLSKESVPLLERLGQEYAANRARIRSWRGRVEYSQAVGRPGEKDLRELEKGTIRFVYDAEKELSLTVYQQTKVAKEGEAWRLRATMLTEDGYYYYASYHPEHFPPRYNPTLTIDTADAGRRGKGLGLPQDFRPLRVSTPSVDTGSFMLGYAKGLRDGMDLSDTTLVRKESIVRLRNELNGVVNEFALDLDKGSSLVEFVTRGSDPTLVWSSETENVAGVFVPKVVIHDSIYGKERWVQRMEWFDQVVNEPLPKDTFTIAKLGVHRGDRVQDNRTGTSYELSDENLPPRVTPGIAEDLRETSNWRRILLAVLVVNGVLVILLVVGVRIYRRSSTATRKE